MSKDKTHRLARRQPYSAPTDLDAPIFGAPNIAAAAGLFTETGDPDLDRLYYKKRAGLLSGIVHKNGRELVSTRRQLQRLGTITVVSPPEKTASPRRIRERHRAAT
jgi:hypothetical protein